MFPCIWLKYTVYFWLTFLLIGSRAFSLRYNIIWFTLCLINFFYSIHFACALNLWRMEICTNNLYVQYIFCYPKQGSECFCKTLMTKSGTMFAGFFQPKMTSEIVTFSSSSYSRFYSLPLLLFCSYYLFPFIVSVMFLVSIDVYACQALQFRTIWCEAQRCSGGKLKSNSLPNRTHSHSHSYTACTHIIEPLTVAPSMLNNRLAASQSSFHHTVQRRQHKRTTTTATISFYFSFYFSLLSSCFFFHSFHLLPFLLFLFWCIVCVLQVIT